VSLLSVDEIVEVNRQIILRTGGATAYAGQVANKSSLRYIAEAGDAEFGGESLYPTVFHKAAIYAYFVSRDHVFVDGNKRTSMACALWFLRINGIRIRPDLEAAEIVEQALGIACGQLAFDDIVRWLEEIAEQLDSA
jgi:death-on-curing protein